jgi:hypothetical protein
MITIYATGRREAIVPIEIESQGGVAIATAEDEHLTLRQFRYALKQECPEYDWRVWLIRGYWRADGYAND